MLLCSNADDQRKARMKVKIAVHAHFRNICFQKKGRTVTILERTPESFKLEPKNLSEESEQMRVRTFLAYFHLLNFLIMIFVTVYVLNSFWGQMEDWWLGLYSYYLILGLSGVAIALWIGIDGKRLERYAFKIRELEKKLIALEKKIRFIKPRAQEKSG